MDINDDTPYTHRSVATHPSKNQPKIIDFPRLSLLETTDYMSLQKWLQISMSTDLVLHIDLLVEMGHDLILGWSVNLAGSPGCCI